MKDTLPIIDRIKSMIQSTQPLEYDSDPVFNKLYSQVIKCVEADKCFETVPWSSIEDGITIRDIISDLYVYIKNDRPLQINKIIACEVLEKYEEVAQHREKLEEQDNYYLKLIVENRKFIFSNYDNN
jgi:hypothetical protein